MSVETRGKFLFAEGRKLCLRGVTYGTFRPDERGDAFPSPAVVEQDFAAMAASGVDSVRTYTVPPPWLLDAAQCHGLRVMVGLPWEQHVAFLDDPALARRIEASVRAGVRACRGHPAVLCYAVGNEIPATIVRWHGPVLVERFLERLCRAVKEESPGALVTYVNYPSTEYLRLPFLDLVSFNLYLESPRDFASYLARLQNIAVDRPLLLAEVGLDSRRNGEAAQAVAVGAQVRTAFAAGCAGVFLFAWTDEWHRGGYDVDDWDFGLTDRRRRPKPALAAARAAFADAPFPDRLPWPRVSVVVCSYNGSRTIGGCLAGLAKVDYPSFEVIVVDDGSTDGTGAIAVAHGARVIRTPNQGLSSARNTGMKAATGEIVAYVDDDARPDVDWLRYLAATFMTTDYVAVGGPNLPPPGDGPVAACVANAPGGPTHVLLSDDEAEHVPGCNLAVRRDCLVAIGGFDPRFRVAGDDVDLCWRIQARGWKIGFCPAAVVWHHRRNSVRAYWRQQVGYGRAEALLERKWPEKYNAVGHLTWRGRLYGRGLIEALGRRQRVYHGTWGTAPFQLADQAPPGWLDSLALMPEWYLVVLGLVMLCGLGAFWPPLLLAAPLLAAAAAIPLVQAARGASRAAFDEPPPEGWTARRMRVLTMLLHLLQPLARLHGRIDYGISPWRRRGAAGWRLPRRWQLSRWFGTWQPPEARVLALQTGLRDAGVHVLSGSPTDRWDLEARGGLLGGLRLLVAVEEHGAGRQHVRIRARPRLAAPAVAVGVGLLALAAAAAGAAAGVAGVLLGAALLVGAGMVRDVLAADAALRRVVEAEAPAPAPRMRVRARLIAPIAGASEDGT